MVDTRGLPLQAEKLSGIIAMGVRALILENLEEEYKEEFETVLQQQGDEGLLVFGRKRIPNFEKKLTRLLNTIHERITTK